MTSICAIEVEDFKNFRGKASLDLRDLPPGLHRVTGENLANPRLGKNGVGKSSFFSDAVTWCGYGQTVKKRPTTAVTTWNSKKKPRVALTVEKDGKEHVLQRKPGGQGLTVDGEVVGQADAEALLGLSFEAWSQAVVWGQARPLFFDLKPAEKMQLLSDALGLERWERRADAAGDRAKRLQGRHEEVLGRLAGLAIAEDRAQEALEAARGASEHWGAERAARVEETRQAAAAARLRADSLEERRGEAAMAADKAGTAAKLLRPGVEAAAGKLRELEQAARAADRDQRDFATELAEIEEHLAAFADEGECPTCGQKVKTADAKKHATTLRARQTAVKASFKKARQELATTNKQIADLTDKSAEQKNELATLEKAEQQADSELRSLERELAGAQARAAAAEETLKAAEDETNPHRDAVATARRQLAETRAQTKEAEALAAKLAASVERAQFWAKGFREIRLMIVEEVLGDLRETTAAVLEDLGLGDWEVAYATERETKSGTTQRALHVLVTSPTSGEPRDWEDWSGGEGQRLRLAGALALSEVLLAHAGAHLDFRVLDEPTRGLSAEGVADLVEMLGAYAEQARLRIMYVDHTAQDGLAFASTITVVSEADGARIEGN